MSTKFNVIDLIVLTGARTTGCATYSEEINIENTTSAFAESIEPITKFDSFDLAEIPTAVLCNPNKEPLYALGAISNREYKPRFNQLSEFSFRADKFVDDIEMPYFDYLVHKRLVYLNGIDYFMITDVKEKGDGIQKYKEIKCHSLEVEFVKRNLSMFKRTSIQFYNAVSPEGTLLHTILQYMPDWSVGKVNGAFSRKYRSFNITAQKSIYNFLMNDVEQAYECIFEFDTFNKTISAVSVEDATTPTDIYISYDNLIQNIEVDEKTDELVTALSVFGGNGLDINDVNPLGTNTIYDFTYFKNLDNSGSPLWMDESLLDAITNWELLVSGSQAEFAELVTDVKEGYDLLGIWQSEISASRTKLEAKEVELAALIRGNLPTQLVKEQIETLEIAIASGSAIAISVQSTISGSISDMAEISEGLSLDNANNFTLDQQKDLQAFIVEGSYINENIIQTDIMSASSVQAQSQELYTQGQNVLSRISEPRYTFSVNSVNFLQIKEFKPFIRQLQLGALINLEIDEGIVVNPVLLGVDINFDKPANFKLLFGNRLKLDDEALQFSDLMNSAANAATSTQVNSLLWSNWDDNYKDDVTSFITSALDAAVNNVTSGSNQEIIINKSGLRGRQSDGSGGYLDEQVWLVNNTLAFTDDNWDTAKIAIGEIVGPQGQKVWGVVAEYLIGEFIAGGNLLIMNEDSTFIVSGSQAVLTNSDFVINSTSSSTVVTMNTTTPIRVDDASGSALWIDEHGNLTIGGYVNILGQGLDWDDITNKPQLIIDGVPYYYGYPEEGYEGLFLSGTHMGYIVNGEWTSYLDDGGNFVLGNPDEEYGLYWNQTTGSFLISGSIVADGGRISGTLEMSEVNSAITVGYPYTPYRLSDNPLTGEPRFTGSGIWMDRTGFYSVGDGNIQVEISTEDGKFYAGQGSIVLDEKGLSVTELRDALAFYHLEDIIGDLSSSTRGGEEFISIRKISSENSDNLINGDFDEDNYYIKPAGWNRMIPDTTYGGVRDEWEAHPFWDISAPNCMAAAVGCNDLENYQSYEAQSDPIYFEPGATFSAEGYISLVDWNSSMRDGDVGGYVEASLKFYDNYDNLVEKSTIGTQNTNSYVRVYNNQIEAPEGSEYCVYSIELNGILLNSETKSETIGATVDDLILYYVASDAEIGFISSSIELFNEQINYWSDNHIFSGNISFINNSGFSGKINSNIFLGQDYHLQKYYYKDLSATIVDKTDTGYMYVPLPTRAACKWNGSGFAGIFGDGQNNLNCSSFENYDLMGAKAYVIKASAQWDIAMTSWDNPVMAFGQGDVTSSLYWECNLRPVLANKLVDEQFIVNTIPGNEYGAFHIYLNGSSHLTQANLFIIGFYI